MSHALLVVSHGSRRAESNDEVSQLAEKLKAHLHGQFVSVQAAFLELAEPSIPKGIKHCIECGASRVTVMPYFLAAGRHVAEDIPGIIAEARGQYPNIDIRLMPHIGASDFMTEFLATTALHNL